MKKLPIILATSVFMAGGAFIYKTTNKGVDIKAIDRKTNPRDDFNQYANGNWIKNNPVPETESRWTSFNVLAERNYDLLRTILESAASDKNAVKGSPRQKTGEFYRIAMDTVKLEAEGINPLLPDLDAVMALHDAREVMAHIGKMHRKGLPALFGMGVEIDIKKNDQYVCNIAQAGLGLPDRDYYLKEDKKSTTIREAYIEHIVTMFTLFGSSKENAQKSASDIMSLETSLAKASMTRVERRDPEKSYHKRSFDELQKATPAINWDGYFEQTGVKAKHPDFLIIGQPHFFDEVNRQLASADIKVWQNYLKWKVISATSAYLNDVVGNESFRFYSAVLTGTTEQKPRWKRVVNSANNLIGELVGQEYVKVAFSEESKMRMNEMVHNLREAFKIRIQNLDWMSSETKLKALEKLASFNSKLGYPDKWTDYTSLDIWYDSYLANYYRANTFEFDDNIKKLGQPVDKGAWHMLPQTVNAYYSPIMNEIVFPAAIMQPPFFDPAVDDAVNYGAIGAVIGHEFSHGFDDKGSQFDASGNLNNWWTAADKKKFEQRTELMVNQYNAFKIEDNLTVNGELTLGENIADFAGLTVSYDAYMLSLKGKEREKIDGFTPEQRFFIGFAQVWRSNSRPEFLRQQVLTDPHSPPQFRVLGTLSNMPGFYEAFRVAKGDKMYRDDSVRVKIW